MPPKMTEMSKPAEILYRAFLDELKWAKQQQWTITNYILLLMAAVYGLAKLTATSPTFWERIGWCAVVALVGGMGLVVLIDLECHFGIGIAADDKAFYGLAVIAKVLLDPSHVPENLPNHLIGRAAFL